MHATSLFLVALVAGACTATSGADTTHGTPAPRSAVSPTQSTDAQLALARRKIKHVVFLIKENRTFDTMFGRFPGANGATTGKKCRSNTPVKLVLAKDRTPDIAHSINAGI